MNQSNPIRVVIADDHPTFRAGVRATLEPELSITIVGQAGSFETLLEVLGTVHTDVVLLDLVQMGTPPVTAISTLARIHPDVRTIIFSSTLTGALNLIELGAAGYLAKADLEQDIVSAIHTVMKGQRFLSPTVTDHLEHAGLMQKSYGFAQREWNVLQLIADGLSTKEIAKRLGITPKTVGNYIYGLYCKTDCTQRTQLVDWYRNIGSQRTLVDEMDANM